MYTYHSPERRSSLMDINAFRYITALDKYKTISKTARKLFITQPALTNYIKRMEEELGVPLIDRNTKPPQFTVYGTIFLKYAEQIVALDDELHTKLELVTDTGEQKLKIAVTTGGLTTFCQYLPKIGRQYPEITVDLLETDTQTCEEYLLDDILELAVFTTPVQSDDLEYITIAEVPLLIAMSRNNPVLRGKVIRNDSRSNPIELEPEELNGRTFIMQNPRQGMARATEHFFKTFQIQPGKITPMESTNSGFYKAVGSNEIILMPATTDRHLPAGLVPAYCTIRGHKLSRSIILARKKGAKLSGAAQKIWDLII